jgi:hypothetical protein
MKIRTLLGIGLETTHSREFPETWWDAELKGDELLYLAREISRKYSIHIAHGYCSLF